MRSLNQCAQRGFSESVVPNRAILATPTRSGASNLDAIIDEGTLATWLFSGEWRGGGGGVIGNRITEALRE